MPTINEAVMEGSKIALRGLEMQLRQAASSTLSSVLTSATTGPTSIPPSLTSSLPTAASTTTDLNASPTSTNGNGNNNSGSQQGGSQSSPLLFFVALGFGVVFTNLWIIVGVKYCFRYNARNRRMRMNEDGEPINLENMPRPHRRRREKKLMTMDEVNEKFPMLKYKTWVATRAQEGLPTRGGIDAPSRANSIRQAEGIIADLPPKERESTDDRPKTSATSQSKPDGTLGHEAKPSTASDFDAPVQDDDAVRPHTARGTEELPRVVSTMTFDDEEEEDDRINAALPPDALGAAGDTCAICIDTLEDDDDVRGLTCGHAFHAVCLDPWLTSRRACCPLCKADYYTPKPRPQPADGTEGNAIGASITDPRNDRMNLPARPGNSWMGVLTGGSRGRLPLAARFVAQPPSETAQQQQAQNSNEPATGTWPLGFFSRGRQQSAAAAASDAPEGRSDSMRTRLPRPRLGLTMPRFGRRNNPAAPAGSEDAGPASSGADAAASPSQLEAGTRVVR